MASLYSAPNQGSRQLCKCRLPAFHALKASTSNEKQSQHNKSNPAVDPTANKGRPMDSANTWLHRLLGSATAWLLAGCIQSTAEAGTMNGFFMYCTSNFDGTGACINEEDSRAFTCMIVPGQIITCPAKRLATVDCVWISSVSENQAQFWCETEDELAIYNDPSSLDRESNDNAPEATSENESIKIREPDTFINTF